MPALVSAIEAKSPWSQDLGEGKWQAVPFLGCRDVPPFEKLPDEDLWKGGAIEGSLWRKPFEKNEETML